MTQQHPDQKYILGLISGDPEILDEIYQKYSKAIFKLVRDNNGSTQDAQDVIQESLIIVYKKARDKNFKLTSSFFSFFYGVSRFVWLKMQSKKSRTDYSLKEDYDIQDDSNVEEALFKRERHQFYLKKLQELSDGCRKILTLHIEGKRNQEIVKILGLSGEEYVRKRKFKCKKRLMDLIKRDKMYAEFTI